MSASWPIQLAIWTKLTNDATLMANISGVFDQVPQDYDSFPYVTIGEDTVNEWDGDDFVGAEATVMIHVWSRFSGREEAKIVQGYVYDAINRQTLSVTGYNSVECVQEFSETMLDPDGLTRHGVQQFRVTVTRI
jgi:hypothetical protein